MGISRNWRERGVRASLPSPSLSPSEFTFFSFDNLQDPGIMRGSLPMKQAANLLLDLNRSIQDASKIRVLRPRMKSLPSLHLTS